MIRIFNKVTYQELQLHGDLMCRLSIVAMLLLVPLILPSTARSDDLITARVIGVADGDNIIVLAASGKRIIIQLGGIDSPEIGQAFAQEALQFTIDHCLDTNIKYRIFGIDIYNRIIATVYLGDDRELNLEILKAGFAWYDKRHTKRQEYADAENHARRAGIGLWADKNPTPPWEWRRERR